MATLGQRLAWARQAEQLRGIKKRGEFRADVKVVVPADVRDDCEQRSRLLPRSLSAGLLGDPLPGCSALERGPDPRPFRRTDVLDGLRFPG